MKKTFYILFLIFASVLSSCGFENEYSEDVSGSRPPLNSIGDIDESSSQSKDNDFQNIEGYDYGGRTFTIVTTDSKYLSAEQNTGGQTFLSDALNKREEIVETKFNIDITVKVETADKIVENAKLAASTGKFYADLVVAPSNVLSKLVADECLENLNVLPYLDMDAEYVDSSLADAAQINGKLYMLFSSFTQVEYNSWCVFYNEKASEYAEFDPYELYKSGSWTWNAFLEYAQKSKGFSDYGFVTTAVKEDFVNTIWATARKPFFGSCANTALAVPQIENGKQIVSIIEKVINDTSYGKETGTGALDAFLRGDSAMLLCRRDAVYQICESNVDWHAVPLPRYDMETEHIAYVDGDAVAVSVLKGCADTEFVGRVLGALLAVTKETVCVGIDNNELYYYWSDNRTALAMEETKKNVYLDIAILYAYSVKDIATVTTENLATALKTGIAPFQFYHSTQRQFEIYASKAFG